jgi:hypothetical protein
MSRVRTVASAAAAAEGGAGTAAEPTTATGGAGSSAGASGAAVAPSVSLEEAQRLELYYANWILAARGELELRSPTMYATAMTFFRRFFIHQVGDAWERPVMHSRRMCAPV